MTINKAIVRIEVFLRDVSEVEGELLDDALRLGVEALKRCRVLKQESLLKPTLLPGETEE